MSAQERQSAAGGAAGDWVEQTQALTRAWQEAQAGIWGEWYAMTGPAASAAGKFFGDWMGQWQTLANSAFAGRTDESSDTVRDVLGRVLSGEQAFLSFVELLLGAMRTVSPTIDVGDDWMELLRRFLDQTREDLMSGHSVWTHPGGLADAGGDVNELGRLYAAELQRLFGPWASAYANAALNFAKAGSGDPTAVRESFAGFFDAFEVTLGRSLAAPSVGYSRESSERVLRSFDAWVEMNRASMDFQTELANEGLHVVEALFARLVEMGEKGEQITSMRELFDLWSDMVDGAYVKLFGSDAFATLQGRYVNASMEFRKRQGELLDEMMETMGLPGRKEVDQVHRHVHDLRIELRWVKREMRELRRELKAREAASGAAEAAPAQVAEAGDGVERAAPARPAAKKKATSPAAKRRRRSQAADPDTPKP